MVRLVLFDIDGTLIRTGGAGVHAFERTAQAEFRVRDGMRNMRFPGRTDLSLVGEFFQAHQIAPTPANFQRFFGCYVFLLDQSMGQFDGRVCPGVWELLRGLKALLPPPLIGLLTGNIRLGAEIKLRQFGLWDFFEVGAFGDDHEDRHQLAAIALRRARQMAGRELRASETVVVGDTPSDIACGRAIGAKVLAVGTGGASLDELKQHRPNWLLENLDGLSAAALCLQPTTSDGR